MIVFPHAGGGTMFYKKFVKSFKKTELSIIQYPGREDKYDQHMPDSLCKLADELFKEYREWFKNDFVIWGHSMGSTVGYEVAKRCEKELHNSPIAFFSSGAEAPCSESTEKEKAMLESKEAFEEFINVYGGIDDQLKGDKDFCDFFYPIIRGDVKVAYNYKDSEFIKLHCPLRLIEGTDDVCRIDKWKLYTNYDINIKYHKGGHFFINDYKQEVADYIEKSAMEIRCRMKGRTRVYS